MKLLITGAGGFIGRNLAEWLGPRHLVTAPPRGELNLLDAEAVRQYLARHRFDAVIHAASEGVSRRAGGSADVFANNCRMFFNLARNTGSFGRMLFLGSGAVYDRAHWHARMREEEFGAHIPTDDYGLSKYVCAQALGDLREVYELRLFGVFGRYEDWRIRFVSNAICRALWGLPLEIGRNSRFDYLDVEDVCCVAECCLEQKLEHRHYNVCRGEGVELTEVAAKIAALAGGEPRTTVRDPAAANEYSGDPSRLMATLEGWRCRDLDESLARLYRWYEARKGSLDPALLE